MDYFTYFVGQVKLFSYFCDEEMRFIELLDHHGQ